jgi:chromosome segregation ATPase
MTENETPSFRLGSGSIEEIQETEAQNDAISQIRFKRLQRRGRITSLLLLGLTILLFAWGYGDLHNRFAHQANSGNREIKNITAIFDDRLNQLDQKFSAIEKQLGEDFAKLDTTTVKLQKNIDQLQQGLNAIDVSGALNKEKKAMQEQMRKAFDPIKKDIDDLTQNIGAFDKRIQTQMAPLEKQIDQTRQALRRLEKSVQAAAGARISRDDLALEMLKVKKSYQQRIADEAATIRKQVSLMTERLERLEERVRAAKTTSPPAMGPVSGSGIQEQNLP